MLYVAAPLDSCAIQLQLKHIAVHVFMEPVRQCNSGV